MDFSILFLNIKKVDQNEIFIVSLVNSFKFYFSAELVLSINRRKTIGDLKKKIEPLINVEQRMFRVIFCILLKKNIFF